eukprot:TRINITY_DN4639_c0_g1_i2.p1 TRINITY_DN4639_c0_g1~~TRINITY_DN4639_c0_g1_i2.p1  ORF type:complete len:104 (+),score=4.92 TRINITY_DN4639_c0_g1_i2:139-450(+)
MWCSTDIAQLIVSFCYSQYDSDKLARTWRLIASLCYTFSSMLPDAKLYMMWHFHELIKTSTGHQKKLARGCMRHLIQRIQDGPRRRIPNKAEVIQVEHLIIRQ